MDGAVPTGKAVKGQGLSHLSLFGNKEDGAEQGPLHNNFASPINVFFSKTQRKKNLV